MRGDEDFIRRKHRVCPRVRLSEQVCVWHVTHLERPPAPSLGWSAQDAGTFAWGSQHFVFLIRSEYICYLKNFGLEGVLTAAKVRH